MEDSHNIETHNGFTVFSVTSGAKAITLEDIKKLEDEKVRSFKQISVVTVDLRKSI